MTEKRRIFLVAFALIALASIVLSHSLVGRFTITAYKVDGITQTYSVERNLLSSLGRSRFSFSKRKLRESLLNLPYIEEAVVKVRGNSIIINGIEKKEGLIITDGENWYFYSDTFYPIEGKDVQDLRKNYLVLLFEQEFLSRALSSTFGNEELKMIDTLKGLKESSCLITKAEYDNNNSSVFSGSLLLRLDTVGATLLLCDIREIERLEETLGIIEEEYMNSKDRVSREETKYVLQNGSLVRMR